MSRFAISNICSNKSKVKVILQGQMLKFLQKALFCRGFHFSKIFIFCYSLLKVHLQLRGFSVFLDIERLNAGKFDEGLLTSIAQSKNFVLILTQDALERCKGDLGRKDWVHRVSLFCFNFMKFSS